MELLRLSRARHEPPHVTAGAIGLTHMQALAFDQAIVTAARIHAGQRAQEIADGNKESFGIGAIFAMLNELRI